MSWKELPPIAKFSIIAFAIALILGILTLGTQGLAIYYAVEFALPVSINSLRGHALWPSIVLAGMAWSVGFLVAGWICVRIPGKNQYIVWLIYAIILWLWDYLVWWAVIALEVVR